MEPAKLPPAPPPPQEKSVTVREGQNRVVAGVHGHTWVSVSTGQQQLIASRTADPRVGFLLAPGSYVLRTDGQFDDVTTDAVPQPPPLVPPGTAPALLRLSDDSRSRHAIDGVGEIPADGKSYCTLTVEKIGQDGKRLTGDAGQGELFLRTTGGILMDEQGKQPIRTVKLQDGRATFRLVSEAQPRAVTVTVMGQGLIQPRADVQLEFVMVPPRG